MCGKFTAKASWTEIVDYIWSTPLDEDDDRTLTYRVMNPLPVVVLDIVTGALFVIGFSSSKCLRRSSRTLASSK